MINVIVIFLMKVNLEHYSHFIHLYTFTFGTGLIFVANAEK